METRFRRAERERIVRDSSHCIPRNVGRFNRVQLSLSNEQQEEMLSNVLRYIIFQTSIGEPLKRDNMKKVLGDNIKRDKTKSVFNYILALAEDYLKNVFGYKLLQVPEGRSRSKGASEGTFYVVNTLDPKDEKIREAICHSTMESATSAFLFTVLAGIFTAGPGKKIDERSLWGFLYSLDSRIKVEPLTDSAAKSAASNGNLHGWRCPAVDGLGEPLELMRSFESRAYILRSVEEASTPAREQMGYYSLGPRAFVEIGRPQILAFLSSLLGHQRVDKSVLTELSDYEDEDEGKNGEGEGNGGEAREASSGHGRGGNRGSASTSTSATGIPRSSTSSSSNSSSSSSSRNLNAVLGGKRSLGNGDERLSSAKKGRW